MEFSTLERMARNRGKSSAHRVHACNKIFDLWGEKHNLIRRNFREDKFSRIFAQRLYCEILNKVVQKVVCGIARKLVPNFWCFVEGARKFLQAKISTNKVAAHRAKNSGTKSEWDKNTSAHDAHPLQRFSVSYGSIRMRHQNINFYFESRCS